MPYVFVYVRFKDTMYTVIDRYGVSDRHNSGRGINCETYVGVLISSKPALLPDVVRRN